MNEFWDSLKNNPELLKEVKKQTTKEGLYQVAKPYIGEMTQEEFITDLNSHSLKPSHDGELSDDDLSAASGGWGFGVNLGFVSFYVGS